MPHRIDAENTDVWIAASEKDVRTVLREEDLESLRSTVRDEFQHGIEAMKLEQERFLSQLQMKPDLSGEQIPRQTSKVRASCLRHLLSEDGHADVSANGHADVKPRSKLNRSASCISETGDIVFDVQDEEVVQVKEEAYDPMAAMNDDMCMNDASKGHSDCYLPLKNIITA